MTVKVKDLHRHHPLVEAALAMEKAYQRHETLIPAMEEVRDDHPGLTEEQAILLWLGCNAALNPE